jgi:hypothetical protein
LFLQNQKSANSRGQVLRFLRVKNAAKREESNDYFKILAMLPANFPDRDDVVGDIFEALLDGRPPLFSNFPTTHPAASFPDGREFRKTGRRKNGQPRWSATTNPRRPRAIGTAITTVTTRCGPR